MRAPADDDVLELIHTIMHLFRSQQYRALRDEAVGLSHMEGKALGFFCHHPGTTPTELVARSGRDKGQIARLIRDLRERGLLDAMPDPNDRRSLRLSASPAGAALHASLHGRAQAIGREALRGLTADDQRALLALLRRVRDNLDRVDAGSGSRSTAETDPAP